MQWHSLLVAGVLRWWVHARAFAGVSSAAHSLPSVTPLKDSYGTSFRRFEVFCTGTSGRGVVAKGLLGGLKLLPQINFI